MTYSQLYVNLKVNNQVTIGLQSTRQKNDSGKNLHLTHNQVAERQIEKKYPLKLIISDHKFRAGIERKYREAVKKSPDFLRWYTNGLSPLLDITQKLQRSLDSFPCNLFGFLTLRYFLRSLSTFGQFRKNEAKRFGHIQAQHIHECGAAIELLTKEPRFCHVTTLTLPANHTEAFECIAARSGDAINRLFQPIRRLYPDTNNWFFVWEYQKRGALHLHIAHYHPDECEGMLIGNILIDQWHKILCDISETSGIDMFLSHQKDRCTVRQFHQHHTQPMRKSVAGYFSKYASKASEKDENNYVKKFSQMYPPTRFWGCSKEIKLIRNENSFHNCRDYTEQKDFMCFLFVRIHKMISECQIILQKNYSFKKDLTENLCVAEGFRNIFYLSPDDYQKILSQVKEDFACF